MIYFEIICNKYCKRSVSYTHLASGNIIKNVKSVVVPGTNGMKGIEAAVAAGLIGGKSEKKLEVISEVTEEEKEQIRDLVEKEIIEVGIAGSDLLLDVQVQLKKGDDSVFVRIANAHTNVVLVEKNGVRPVSYTHLVKRPFDPNIMTLLSELLRKIVKNI